MTALFLVLLAAGSFLLRTVFSAPGIFLPGYLRFQGSDAWYHVRLIENLVRNFPHFITHDPYGRFPDGQVAAVAPFFDLLLAGIVRAVHGADATPEQIQVMAAWYPAVLGSLIPVAVFFVGRRLFGRAAGMIAGVLVSVMPSTLLLRSTLAFTDHHVLEILLSTVVLLLVMLALTPPGAATGDSPRLRVNSPRFLLTGGLAGMMLGTYLWTWIGGGVLVFILFVFLLVQALLDHQYGRSLRPLGVLGMLASGLALAMTFPVRHTIPLMHLQVTALALTFALSGGLWALSAGLRRIRAPRPLFPVAVVAAFVAGLGVFRVVAPELFATLVGMIQPSGRGGGASSVQEAAPLSYLTAWRMYLGGIVLALPGMVLLGFRVTSRARPGEVLLLVWSLFMVQATFVQGRFTYYLAVNVALLAALFIVEVAGLLTGWLTRSAPEAAPRWRQGLVLALFLGVAGTMVGPAVEAVSTPFGLSPPWHESLNWLRRNTPDPFDDPDYYTARYGSDPEGMKRPAYGVAALWDYGYWIINVARRVPVANPTQSGAGESSRLLIARGGEEAGREAEKTGTRYLILDGLLPMRPGPGHLEGKLYAAMLWAGEPTSKYFDICYRQTDEGMEPMALYYPAYYQCLASHLYLFDGRAVPQTGAVIVAAFEPRLDLAGRPRKLLTDIRTFSRIEEAQAYYRTVSPQNHVLGGVDPTRSCVPLEALPGWRLVHQSAGAPFSADHVKIFEVVGS